MEYVETSKRTLVGNIGLALCLTISGMYQPWLLRYRLDAAEIIVNCETILGAICKGTLETGECSTGSCLVN